MRWKGTLVLIVGMLLAASSIPAAASVWENVADSGVTVAESREGDQLRYARTLSWDEDAPETMEVVVLLEGAARASDRFGLERDVETYLIDVARDGEWRLSHRCAALASSVDVVRRDVLEGELFASYAGSHSNVLDVVSRGESTARFLTATMFDGDCTGRNPLAGQTLREGDTLALADVAGLGLRFEGVADASEPGVATTFEGRPALAFHFPALGSDAPGSGLTATFADGLPGVVAATLADVGRVHTEYGRADTDVAPLNMSMVAYEPGTGAALAARTHAALPGAIGGGARYVPLGFDDAAFGFAYAFDDAMAAVLQDRSTCVPEFIARHEDAYLQRVTYDASQRDHLAPDVPTDGAWTLEFRAGGEYCGVESIRMAPQGPQALSPAKPVRNYGDDLLPTSTTSGEALGTLPSVVMRSHDVASLIEREGVRVEDIQYLYWGLGAGADGTPAVRLRVSTIPVFGGQESGTFHGSLVELDAIAGGMRTIYAGEADVRRELSVDPTGVTFRFPAYEAGVLGALSGPVAGAGLALTTLAGLALVLTVVKFAFVPFYTRLRRAALLENPVRARLYDQVRQDPGVHQAQLVGFSGIGRAATVRHLDRLVKFQYLVELREGGHTRYYAAGEVPPELARRAAALRTQTARAVYALYRAEPDLPLREAARRLGISAPSVHKAKRKLEAQGLLGPKVEVVTVEA